MANQGLTALFREMSATAHPQTTHQGQGNKLLPDQMDFCGVKTLSIHDWSSMDLPIGPSGCGA